ncbi:MAG TPA: thioesterase family protein [Stellaceae bacterium]|nr:thioesterase family protein [Stellaceae bacterium]
MAAAPPVDPGSIVPPLTDRTGYELWHSDKLRFADMDRQNHVNNALFSTFFEGGRVAFLDREIRPYLEAAEDPTVLARITLDYLGEMRFPGLVEVGTRILRVGRTSLNFGQGLFNDGRCTAIAVSTVVVIDRVTRRAKPFSPELARRLAALAET